MPINSQAFRDTLCHFPAGVTLVTIKAGEQIHGMTVTAFVSISAEPPLIAVVIDHRGRGHQLLEQPDAVFAVNILHEGQEALSRRFAFSKEDRFAEGKWVTAVTGAPILQDAHAWLDCTVYDRHVAGGNTIYIGEVQATQIASDEQKPLVYWNRCYSPLALSSDAQEKLR
jgi:3-hydroxy-9,10-secoandrosta-1,3,5(10)-triene-9,17-dione monooxygenase reductase component